MTLRPWRKEASQRETVPDDLADYEVLVGVCGGIAAYKICSVVSELVQRGAGVQVVMTRAARKFIGPVTSYDEAGIRGVLLTSKRFGDAEVEDEASKVGRHENVGRLDVTMNDIATMCSIERLGNLRDHLHHAFQRPWLSRKLVS